jgi:hypothetical protein
VDFFGMIGLSGFAVRMALRSFNFVGADDVHFHCGSERQNIFIGVLDLKW